MKTLKAIDNNQLCYKKDNTSAEYQGQYTNAEYQW
jgi:hypothetical protein